MPNFKLLIALFLFPLFVTAQQEKELTIDSVAAELVRSIQQDASEKILLTTDKEIYVAGETLRIKALPVNTVNNKITRKNKVLYTDLVDDKDSVFAQMLLNAGDVKTSGHIVLDNFLPTGFYWVRAYTKNMSAANAENMSVIPVYILNEPGSITAKKDIKQPVETNKQVAITIFPEGGNLISGIDNVVALQAVNNLGKPLVLTGIVKDAKGAVVTKFSTSDRGLAKLIISPAWYGNYGVFVQHGDSYDSITSLPKVNLFAGQLSVMEQNQQALKIQVMLEDSIYKKNYATYVLGLHNDSLCFAGVGHGRYIVNIPVADFPGGVANLYLFNEAGKLLSQRAVYINKQNVNVAISTDKTNYNARENVQMNIKVNDADNKPLLASLSVAVTDNIINAAEDFSHDEFGDSLPGDTDLEMLVRKPAIRHTNAIQNALPYEDSLASLSGTVLYKGKGVPGTHVLFMAAQGSSVILEDTTDAQGRFQIGFSYLPDSTAFAVQVSDLKGRLMDYDIVMDTSTFPKLRTPDILKEKFSVQQQKLLTIIKEKHIDAAIIDYKDNWLKTATVTTSRKQDDVSTEPKHNIITQQMLIEKGYDNAGTAVLANGTFRILGGYLIAGGPNTQNGPMPTDEPLVVVDGQQMTVASDGVTGSPVLSFLKNLYARDISYIKILNVGQSGLYGIRGSRGVIEIHSATSTAYSQGTGNMKNIYVKGFSDDSFQIPDYTKKQVKNSKATDTRTTIYWNGNIFTDENGDASVNFFTADPSATYRVTVTGVTAQGFRIYKTITINRK